MLNGFKQFIMRGNVVDLAVGVVIGAAFGAVVTSLVENVITPIISAIAKLPDFSKMVITINGSDIGYGSFLNAIITFLIVAAAIYFIVVVPMGKLMAKVGKTQEPTTKSCEECCSEVPIAARRCKHCGQPVV
jgi:large conductance mechanosensitive channel